MYKHRQSIKSLMKVRQPFKVFFGQYSKNHLRDRSKKTIKVPFNAKYRLPIISFDVDNYKIILLECKVQINPIRL